MIEHIQLLIAKILNGESLLSQCCSPALGGNCPCFSEDISSTVQKFVTHFLLFLSAYQAGYFSGDPGVQLKSKPRHFLLQLGF